jgi:hypothetical protein
MTQPTPNRSSRILGRDYGLNAVEMNQLLKQQGILYGEPGAYGVTDKGKPHAVEQHHRRGTGGYPFYNPSFDTVTWASSIADALDVSDEQLRQARAAASAARQQKAASRAAQAAAFDSGKIDDGETNDSGSSYLKVTVVGLVFVAATYAIYAGAPHLKALWTDKAGPRFKKWKNRTAGDPITRTGTADGDEDPST